MTSRIPPIQCLLTFEALARLRSVTQAAEEQCVTPSAVSHRVKQLEQLLGVKLFGRADFSLTTEGSEYLAHVREGLASLTKYVEPLAAVLDHLGRQTQHTSGHCTIGIADEAVIVVAIVPGGHGPADHRLVEGLGPFRVRGHQLVPDPRTVRLGHGRAPQAVSITPVGVRRRSATGASARATACAAVITTSFAARTAPAPGRWAAPPRPGMRWVPRRWGPGPGGYHGHGGYWAY